MAASDMLLSHVQLVTSKPPSYVSSIDGDLPLLGTLGSLETNAIVTSVTSDLLNDQPAFSNNMAATYPSVTKNMNYVNHTSSNLSSWVPNTTISVTNGGGILPPVTDLRPVTRSNTGFDFLGLLTNSGLNLQNSDTFLDFSLFPKLPVINQLSQPVTKVTSSVSQKALNSEPHLLQSHLVTPQNIQNNALNSSLSQFVQNQGNCITTTSNITTSGDLHFVDSVIPSVPDYSLGCLNGLSQPQDITNTSQWDNSLSLLNVTDSVSKTSNGWQNSSDLLGSTSQAEYMLMPHNSDPAYPEIPETIFSQAVEEMHCYKCKFCPLYVSLSKEDALSHLRSEHEKELSQLIPIPNWNPIYSQSPSLNLKNSSPSPCESQYLQDSLLTSSHKSTDDEITDGSFVCGKCDKNFATLQDCMHHLAEIHNIKSGRIRQDNQDDFSKLDKNIHQQQFVSNNTDTTKLLVCPILSNNAKLRTDKKGKTPASKKDNPVAKCKAKKRKAITPLQKLAREKLKKEQGAYICEFKGCNVRYQLLDNLEYHRKCHILGSTCFSCPECGSQMERWAAMAGHLWRNHLVDLELNACDQCSFRTYSLSKLENLHKRTHGIERAYLCDTCGKKFKTSKQLYNHKSVHELAVIQDSCSICNRAFTDKRLLRIHMNTVHRKVRPFVCNFCGYAASNRSTLKMHLRQHTGEKPFACDMCKYRTADHNSLRRHKMTHSGEKPYKCPYCRYACIQSNTYKDHLDSKHPDKNEGLMFFCTECPFRTLRQDLLTMHVSDHKLGLTRLKASASKNVTQLLVVPLGEGLVEETTMQEMSLANALQMSIGQLSSNMMKK